MPIDLKMRADSLRRRFGLQGVPMPVLACVTLVCAVLLLVALVQFWPGSHAADAGAFTVELDAADTQASHGEPQERLGEGAGAGSSSAQNVPDAAAEEENPPESIKIDVEGAVAKPGLYELAAGARVGDALDAAGGFAKGAYRKGMNLAQPLTDGMQLYVETRAEAAKREKNTSAESSEAALTGGSTAASGQPAGQQDVKDPGGRIDINTSNAAQLQELPGVGPVLAASIVAYREENGAFVSVADLKQVPGIGDARYAQIEGLVCV